jgi:hypothetical protein
MDYDEIREIAEATKPKPPAPPATPDERSLEDILDAVADRRGGY